METIIVSIVFIVLSSISFLLNKKLKKFSLIVLLISISTLIYGIVSLYSYPTLTSSASKQQLEEHADIIIYLLPEDSHNCTVIDLMYEDMKKNIINENGTNIEENLKRNNDLFNIISYKLKLNCSKK